jgi:hypothetical protein
MLNVVNQVAYLRTSREFPEEIHQLAVEDNKAYVDIALAVNNRIIGIFPINRPAITGESWFLTTNRQQTLRQVYSFGAIAAGTELDIPHGITNFVQFTRIYGTVITVVPDYRPLPYVDPITLTTGIGLLVGTVAGVGVIRIIVGATSPNITSGTVVLEWLSAV